MNTYEKIITLDVDTPDCSTVVYAKQNDNLNRKLLVILKVGGVAFEKATGDMAVFRYTRPNGTNNIANATILGNGFIEVTFDEQLLAVPGKIVCDVEISNSGTHRLSTPLFIVQNDKSPTGETQLAKLDDYQLLLQTVAKATVDNARLNELIESGTPEGAEVIDIRVGADGHVYSTAGGAVRAQVTALNNLLTKMFPLSYENAIQLEDDADLNDLAAGSYYVSTAAHAATIANAPTTSAPFRVVAFSSTGDSRYFQLAFANIAPSNTTNTGFYIRRKIAISGAWSEWTRIANINYVQDYVDLKIADATPKTIRVMQYNCGRWRWGYVYSGSLEEHGLTEAQYQEKLKNYKKMFAKYQPDIIGLQEWERFMDKAQTRNAVDELFGGLYADGTTSGGGVANVQIFDNAVMTNKRLVTLHGTTEEGADTTFNWYVGDLHIGDRVIAVATGALSSGSQSARIGQLTQLLTEKIDDYEYAIILSDMNSSLAITDPTYQNVPTDEGNTIPNSVLSDSGEIIEQLNAIAEANGYISCNKLGGFWGATESYFRHTGLSREGRFRCLDNILVKGNIKVKNFEVLYDEYENLASDHVPIIADLYIY